MRISGSCHCGNIAFALDWTPEPAEIPARACTCTFCTRHGGVWTAHPGASLRIRVRDRSLVSDYAFGTGTAAFHVCSACGVVPVATSRIDDRLYAVVNVNTFDDVDTSLLRRASSNLESETETDRLARRARNWIADVAFV
jgi:hypothetical protein